MRWSCPETTEQVAQIVRLAAKAGVPVVPRGAGTGLSGGSVPVAGGLVVVTSRLRRILEVNAEDRYAVVEAGVVNVDLTAAVAPLGLYYAPDPSSQRFPPWAATWPRTPAGRTACSMA